MLAASRADAVAGLTAAAIVIPNALAYTTIAGLPLEVGLYTAFIPMIAYALLGTSGPMSVSSTTTIAILTASALTLAVEARPGVDLLAATAMLSILVGAILLVARALRLGFVADFISDPVLAGFKAGVGLVLVVDQLPKLLGIQIEKAGFLHNILAIAARIPDASAATVAVAAATFATILLLRRFVPRVPAPLVAVGAGIAACAVLGLEARGVRVVGAIPGGLPALTLPDLSLAEILWPPAVGIALMSFTETIAVGRTFLRDGDRRPDSNRELVAIGAGNVAGGFLGAMPSGGGTSQTAVNFNAGARTQAAELVTAGAALATMLFLAPVLARMPSATLAAVVTFYAGGMIKPADFIAIRRVRTLEFRWAIAAFAGVVLLGTLKGILVAVILSMVSLLLLANNPPLYVLGRKPGTHVFRPRDPAHPEDEAFPGLLILRTEGRMYFANAPVIGAKVRELVGSERPKVVAFDCGAIPGFEYTALRMLVAAEAKLREGGTELWLVALNPEALEMIRRTPLAAALGRERMFFDVQSAVSAYRERAGA
jgi:sulfate permease, SulP family